MTLPLIVVESPLSLPTHTYTVPRPGPPGFTGRTVLTRTFCHSDDKKYTRRWGQLRKDYEATKSKCLNFLGLPGISSSTSFTPGSTSSTFCLRSGAFYGSKQTSSCTSGTSASSSLWTFGPYSSYFSSSPTTSLSIPSPTPEVLFPTSESFGSRPSHRTSKHNLV